MWVNGGDKCKSNEYYSQKIKKCKRKKRCTSGEVFNEQLEKCTSSQSQSSWT